MWSVGSRMGCAEPKGMMQKGGYHTIQNLIGPCFPVSDKQFSYYKNTKTVDYSQNYEIPTKMDVIEEKPCKKVQEPITISKKMQEPITINNPEVQSRLCNNHNKKKKKKRRRRKKKSQSKTSQETKQRQRQLSTASEENFIIFFDEDKNDSDEDETETCDFSSSESIIPRKKVRFLEDEKLCEVHPMVAWSFAYHAARRGPWEEYARDRDRFKCRIRRAEIVLNHVFSAEHRSKIYQQRFC